VAVGVACIPVFENSLDIIFDMGFQGTSQHDLESSQGIKVLSVLDPGISQLQVAAPFEGLLLGFTIRIFRVFLGTEGDGQEKTKEEHAEKKEMLVGSVHFLHLLMECCTND
jgi:hypothetical protein